MALKNRPQVWDANSTGTMEHGYRLSFGYAGITTSTFQPKYANIAPLSTSTWPTYSPSYPSPGFIPPAPHTPNPEWPEYGFVSLKTLLIPAIGLMSDGVNGFYISP
jgi:hypothetical protein